MDGRGGKCRFFGCCFSSEFSLETSAHGRVVGPMLCWGHIKKLRQKLKQLDSNVEYVHSVYGIGYKFEVGE